MVVSVLQYNVNKNILISTILPAYRSVKKITAETRDYSEVI